MAAPSTKDSHVLYVPSPLAAIPALLTSLGYEPRFIHDHQDKVAYVLHLIVTLPRFHSCCAGYTELCQKHLARVIGTRYVREILDLLLAAGAIECDEVYVPVASDVVRAKAYGYRIAPNYHGKLVGLMVMKETFAGALQRAKQADAPTFAAGSQLGKIWSDLRQLRVRFQEATSLNERIYETTTAFLEQCFDQLAVSSLRRANYLALEAQAASVSDDIELLSFPDLRKILRNRHVNHPETTVYEVLLQSSFRSYTSNLMTLRKIHERKVPEPKRKLAGSRVYTVLTSLSRRMRPFLYHAKHEASILVNLDIANSQPFFLNLLLVQKYAGQALPEDAQEYIRLTSSGKFYEHVAYALDTPLDPNDKRQRTRFKGSFFSNMFFCETHHTEKSKAGIYFRRAFPHVDALIRDQKRAHYSHLAINMQAAEAQLMIDQVQKSLQREGIWSCSIHDSLVTLPQHAPLVKERMLSLFLKRFQLTPNIKPEPLDPTKTS